MKISYFVSFIVGLFVLGSVIYCIKNNIIIIRNLNAPYTEYKISHTFREQKKQIILFFFKNGAFKQEVEHIVLTENKQENIMILINRWLSLLADEQITPFRVNLQSASYDNSGTKVIISFEQSFLSASDSLYKKLMCIESLLMTIRQNAKEIQELYLLVHHQPLQDPHIDTSRAWPIHGFTQSS